MITIGGRKTLSVGVNIASVIVNSVNVVVDLQRSYPDLACLAAFFVGASLMALLSEALC